MKMFLLTLLVLFAQMITPSPSQAQICLSSSDQKAEAMAYRKFDKIDGSYEALRKVKREMEVEFIYNIDANLARAYLEKYGGILSKRFNNEVVYFIEASEKSPPRYSDINQVVAATNLLFSKIHPVSRCEAGTFQALVDLRITLNAAADVAQSQEFCKAAAERFSNGATLAHKAMAVADPLSVEPGQDRGEYKRALDATGSEVKAAYQAVGECRRSRSR